MAEAFSWSRPELNRLQFHALANLLSLRNGGQAEEETLLNDILDDDSETFTDAQSIATAQNEEISTSGHDTLKKKFLSCLAEFAANEKGGKAVTCTVMREAEDEVMVWITRNRGFSEQEREQLESLGQKLSMLSRNRELSIEETIWNDMLGFHQKRFAEQYIPELRSAFKAYEDSTASNLPCEIKDKLSDLRNLVFESSNINAYSNLVSTAYTVRRMETFQNELFDAPNATAKSKKLWTEICFASRLRIAFEKFKEIALTLPNFVNITIVPVTRAAGPIAALKKPLDLKEVFEILDLKPDTLNVKQALGHKWTFDKAKQQFSTRQKQKLNIHCEVQMLIFLATDTNLMNSVFPYFGCSKLCCFMCGHLLQAFGKFSYRGCHGALFKPWTVPDTEMLGPGQAEKLSLALLKVHGDIKENLTSSVRNQIPQAKTSHIGGSSILSGHSIPSTDMSALRERASVQAAQGRVTEEFRRLSAETNVSASKINDESEEDFEGKCIMCDRITKRKCSRCDRDLLCSKSCQDRVWGSHLFTCNIRPITSADYLYMNIILDSLPDSDEVLEHFGFSNLASFADRSKLLGLYQGLHYLKVTPFDVHKWRLEGTLLEHIKEEFCKLPEGSRGGYFPWFLENMHKLKMPPKDGVQSLVEDAKRFLEPEDQINNVKDLRPFEKSESHKLLGQLLSGGHPNPIEENWYQFGFCTCEDEHEESRLAWLYIHLLVPQHPSEEFWAPKVVRNNTATFTEFWQAFKNRELIQLMDSKGLKEERSKFKYLEEFLSSEAQFSVWILKQFLEINDPIQYPPDQCLDVDYGFLNCDSWDKTCTLMEIYRKVLKVANPLDLHKAAVKGELFEFAKKSCPGIMKEEYRELMVNYSILHVKQNIEN